MEPGFPRSEEETRKYSTQEDTASEDNEESSVENDVETIAGSSMSSSSLVGSELQNDSSKLSTAGGRATTKGSYELPQMGSFGGPKKHATHNVHLNNASNPNKTPSNDTSSIVPGNTGALGSPASTSPLIVNGPLPLPEGSMLYNQFAPPIPFCPHPVPDSGMWCQMTGPYGQSFMAWVPAMQRPLPYQAGLAPVPASLVPPTLIPSTPLRTWRTPKGRELEEENKERLRIRESRRAETLRRYMEGTGPKPAELSAGKKIENAKMDTATHENTSHPLDGDHTTYRVHDATGPKFVKAVRKNGSDTSSSSLPSSVDSVVKTNTQSYKSSKPAANHRLYGRRQPRSYGYGDIIPQNIQYRSSATKEDRDRALEMLVHSYDEFRRKQEAKLPKDHKFPEHLADYAAVVANFNRGGQYARQMAHRQIEQEYANQRRLFHDAIDALQVPAIQNPAGRWICALCPNDSPTYQFYKHLLRHAANHLDIKPFKCPFCFRLFRRSDTARRHQASCVQLSLAVQQRMGHVAQTNGLKQTVFTAQLENCSSPQSATSASAPVDDETSEEELEDESSEVDIGNPTSSATSLPPVVMPIDK